MTWRAGIPRLPNTNVGHCYRYGLPGGSFDKGLYWGLFIFEDLQMPRLMQRLSLMYVISTYRAVRRRHLLFYKNNISEAR